MTGGIPAIAHAAGAGPAMRVQFGPSALSGSPSAPGSAFRLVRDLQHRVTEMIPERDKM